MMYRVTHQTEYAYEGSVSLCHNEIRLIPRNLPYQQLIGKQIKIDPQPSAYREREDFFGNRVSYFSIQQSHLNLSISISSSVRIDLSAKVSDLPTHIAWEKVRERLKSENTPAILEARQYVLDSPLIQKSPGLFDYAVPSFLPERPVLEACRELMSRIFEDFDFKPGFTTISTPLSHVLEHRRGVCQDFAHLAVGCLRSLGLSARYVSGYIETLPPPGREKLKGADASHAWFSVFVPDLGWMDFDPTNNLVPAEQHIVISWGRDFSDVTPVKGVVFSGGGHKLRVSVDVERKST